MDDVSRYLQASGFATVPEKFLGSDFELGQRLNTDSFQLIYRQEGERLILCELNANPGNSHAVLAVMTLLRKILKAVPVIRYIDAMILSAPQNPQLNQMRQRLADLMLAEGAQPVQLEDGIWLRYHC